QGLEGAAKGRRRLGSSTEAIPKYMFTILAVRRDWASANRDTLAALIRADQDALEWLENPANRDAAIRDLVEITKTSADASTKTYDLYITGAMRGKVYSTQAQVARMGSEA